ncbi:MAG: hypothetical protein V4622_07075 [Bacteroidota bacterium]
MKKLLILCIFFNTCVFSQKKFNTFPLFNEVFIAPNFTLFHDYDKRESLGTSSSHEIRNGKGKLGFDIGLRHIFREQKQVNFVYGLEFCFIKSHFDSISIDNWGCFPSFQEYKNISVSNFNISNSFNWRFHFRKSKKFFIETGLLLDFNMRMRVEGQYKNPIMFHDLQDPYRYQLFSRIYGTRAPTVGFNFGFGYNLVFNNLEIGIKPDIKFHILPFVDNPYYFQNSAYSRIVLNFRKLN